MKREFWRLRPIGDTLVAVNDQELVALEQQHRRRMLEFDEQEAKLAAKKAMLKAEVDNKIAEIVTELDSLFDSAGALLLELLETLSDEILDLERHNQAVQNSSKGQAILRAHGLKCSSWYCPISWATDDKQISDKNDIH